MNQDSTNPESSNPRTVQGILGDGPAVADQSPFSLRKTGHDLRNALNVIRNANYLLRRKLMAAGGENVDLVDMIEDSVKLAESIATAIMTHAVQSGEPPASGAAPRPK